MCDNCCMDHLDAQESAPKHNNSSLARKFVLPAIIFLTILGMAIPIFSFYLGYSISFINILYLPLVITCITYPKQGILYTTCISICYFLLLILLPGEPSLFLVALIRVTGLELIALLIIKLSNKKNQTACEL